MDWQQRIYGMIGIPIGISLLNGQGTSGVLCAIQGNTLFVMEYLYHNQFAIKHYDFDMIQNVMNYPPC